MANFTPGPWRVTTGGFSSAPDWVETFSVKGPPSDFMDLENIADAHLIAAAPELYEALNRLMNLNHFHLEDCIYEVREAVLSDEDYDGNTWDHPDVTAFSETVEEIKAAIAKARGEK